MLSNYFKSVFRRPAQAFLLLTWLISTENLNAVPGTVVALAWDPSADTTVAGYNVYYGSSSRNYTNIVPAGASTSTIVSNLASGVTYYFAATTYTEAGLESDYSGEATYAVPLANLPPTLNALTNITVLQESGPTTVNLSGIAGRNTNENQTLTVSAFSSNPGLIPNPEVTYSSPATTGFLTFIPAPGSFGSSIITVMVDDGGTISNTVIRSFTVTVAPPNNPPTIELLTDVVINQNSEPQTVPLTGISCGWTNASPNIRVTATSSNPGLIPNPQVIYTTPASAGTLVLAPLTNCYGASTITVTVMDDQPTNNSTSVSFLLTVNQTVFQPGLLTNAVILPNTTFRYAIKPPGVGSDKVNISLASGAPAGVKLTARKGVTWLVWTPTMSQASTTNLIGITVTSSTNPSLNTNETVQIVVLDYLSLAIGSVNLQAGQAGAVSFWLSSSEGVTNLSFSIPWPTNALVNPTLSVSAAGVASSSLKNQGNNIVVTLQTLSGQSLQGSNIIGSIRFQSLSTQPSSYVSLPVANLSAAKPNGMSYIGLFPASGQVAVINNLAMLQAGIAPSGSRTVTILGKVGNTYQLQYTTNFGPNTVWNSFLTYSQTNLSQTINVDPSISQALYRVEQR